MWHARRNQSRDWQMSSWAALKHPAQDRTGWQSPEHVLRRPWALVAGGMWPFPVPAVSCLGLLILSSCLLADCRFIPEAWSACTVTCGVGTQVRIVRCQVLLSFSQSVADLPVDECEGPKPASQRPCYAGPCHGETPEFNLEETDGLLGGLQDFDQLYDWEYEGFTKCSESCGGGKKGLGLRSLPPSCLSL